MQKTRKYWVDTMLKIASPVLENLAKEELKQKMPIETREGYRDKREPFSHL